MATTPTSEERRDDESPAESGISEGRLQHREKIFQIYLQWTNHQLAKSGKKFRPVTNLHQDLRDGTVLAKLIKIAAGQKVEKIKQSPSSPSDMVDNLSSCLNFMVMKLNILAVKDITPRMIYDGETKPILRVLFSLCEHRKRQQQLSGVMRMSFALESAETIAATQPVPTPAPPTYDQAVQMHSAQPPIVKPLILQNSKNRLERSVSMPRSASGALGKRSTSEAAYGIDSEIEQSARNNGNLQTFSKRSSRATQMDKEAKDAHSFASSCPETEDTQLADEEHSVDLARDGACQWGSFNSVQQTNRSRCGSECSSRSFVSDSVATSTCANGRSSSARRNVAFGHPSRPPNLTKLYLPRLRSTESSPSHSRFTLNPIEEVDCCTQYTSLPRRRSCYAPCKCYITADDTAANHPACKPKSNAHWRSECGASGSGSSASSTADERANFQPLRSAVDDMPCTSADCHICQSTPQSFKSKRENAQSDESGGKQKATANGDENSASEQRDYQLRRLREELRAAQDHISNLTKRLESNSNIASSFEDTIQMIQNRIEQLAALRMQSDAVSLKIDAAAAAGENVENMPDILNINLSDNESIITNSSGCTYKTFSSGYSNPETDRDSRLTCPRQQSVDSDVLTDCSALAATKSKGSHRSCSSCASTSRKSIASDVGGDAEKKKRSKSNWLKSFRAFASKKNSNNQSMVSSVADLPPLSDTSSASTLTLETQQPAKDRSCLPIITCATRPTCATRSRSRSSLPTSSSANSFVTRSNRQEEIGKLRAKLFRRNVKCGDAKFNSTATGTAQEMSDLRLLVLRIQSEMATLKQENDRMQELLQQRNDGAKHA